SVVVVQPGPVRTQWHEDALATLERSSGHGHYADTARAVTNYHQKAQGTAITSTADHVASVIGRAATTNKPRPRYRVGRGARTAIMLSRLPDRVFDAMTRREFGLASQPTACDARPQHIAGRTP